jgi:hypothetical protein
MRHHRAAQPAEQALGPSERTQEQAAQQRHCRSEESSKAGPI